MKTRFAIYFLIIVSLFSCMNSEKLYDKGISEELAIHRKENIKNLEYDLQFDIPEYKDSLITGNIDIMFNVDHAQEIIIDFREQNNVKTVIANGESVKYELKNEHVIIPSDAIRKGGNRISVSFAANNQSFNRNDEFLYTLLVPDRARTIFPCFDQPDLKAIFKLTLTIPESWVAVSNSAAEGEELKNGRRQISFLPTEPLSTYLFSFVAGILKSETYDNGKNRFTAYHRETDPARIAQLPTIFSQVASSLEWLEDFTGIRYPFAKYDFIILPGFQYGGMEHTGATLYNDTKMFLSSNPTPDEELDRAHLIAHETAHMWFGDLVTMKWFNDVWTKEVFANYFASRMTEPMFPGINHRLNWLKSTVTSALGEDRTLGGTAIRQPLDNMHNAGLVYNSIIYNKAPVMLEKLAEIMGEEAFKEGIREYLNQYSYSNASWDDLIKILDDKCAKNLEAFSDVWVNSKGMPFIDFEIKTDTLVVSQSDPYERGLMWSQCFNVCLVGESISEIEVVMDGQRVAIPIEHQPLYILPNCDGRGYGYFRYDDRSLEWMLDNWQDIKDETCRQSQLMNLHEGYQHGRISAEDWLSSLLRGLPEEKNALIASTVCRYIGSPLTESDNTELEKEILALSGKHKLKSCRQQLIRRLIPAASDSVVISSLYNIWEKASHPLLNENDYMNLAYELAIRYPERQPEIIARQLDRIINPDRRRQFEYISRATTPDTTAQQELFRSLLKAEQRRIEPWALETLEYLCHPLREEQTVKYIREALESLPYIQRTSDIFFPQDWVFSLLNGRYSTEALNELNGFLGSSHNFPPLLSNKILCSAWNLQRRKRDIL